MAPEPTVTGFDDTIHAPVRLRISGTLRRVDQIEFAVLRDTLGVTDATLSKHLKVLVEAGYATTTKSRSAARSDARRLTWIAQTRAGRAAFDAHVEELRRIAVGSETGATATATEARNPA